MMRFVPSKDKAEGDAVWEGGRGRRREEEEEGRWRNVVLVKHLFLGRLAHPAAAVKLEEAFEEHLLGALVA